MTASELKYANLIFTEHKKLLTENSLLSEQLNNYKLVNKNLIQVDSIRLNQITELNLLTFNYANKIDKLNTQLENKNQVLKYWRIGGITVSVALILFILLK